MSSPSEDLVHDWTAKQFEIASKVVHEDLNDWAHFFDDDGSELERDLFVGGADISFSTTTEGYAIGTFTVVVLRTSGVVDLVYSRSRSVEVKNPYVSSFLAFREAPVVSELLSELPRNVHRRLDCLLLDGNGVLHPRKAGLACHVGVDEDLATVGVSKALLCVDGLDEHEVREKAISNSEEGIDVIGSSGTVWGRALITGNARNKPIYVSVGHKVSLRTASRLVKKLCEFRVPAPIRFADLHSRQHLRGEALDVYKANEFL